MPNLVTGGQPAASHLAAFKAAGGQVVLDVREPEEPRGFDEPGTVHAAGLEYVNIPVSDASLNDATLERILGVLRDSRDRQVFFHCASGNRVGGVLLPYLMIDCGMDEEDAVARAMRVGLRSPDVLEWGLEYTRRHQQG